MLVQLLQESLVQFRPRHQIFNHQPYAVHLLALLHVKLDLQLRLQSLNRHLKLLHFYKVTVYLHVVFLDVDLHFSNNLL